jgi:hypothetical protein
MTLRSQIIPLVLRLQFPPFLWLFRAYYRLAIQLSRFWVGKVKGVRSIYLSGSWVRKEVIYGLSDLDFKVFVAGEKDQDTYQAIRRRFSLLRRFFPMLGPPDEKGIYFLASFPSDYRHYPLVQHLFDARFFRHRLLWGEALWKDLPLKPFGELDQAECAFARLRDWIERIHLLADGSELCPPQKQHLFFKAVSDVALLARCFRSPQFEFFRRAEILREITPHVDEQHGRLLENLIQENRTCYRKQINSTDDNLRLFKGMVAFCAERASGGDVTGVHPVNIQSHLDPPGEREQAIASSLKTLSPVIRDVSVFRWPQLPLNPFDLNLFNAPTYLVKCSKPLALEEFHRLKAFCRERLRNEAAVLLHELPPFLSSVNSELVDHWGSFQGSSDLMHLLSGASGRHALTETEKRRVETRIQAFQEQLAAALSHPEFGRMDLSVFPRFLLNALRVLIFSVELRHGRWRLFFTPSQIIEYLLQQTPLLPRFLDRLSEQWKRVAGERAGFDERLLPKCRLLLARMLEISENGDSWDLLREVNPLPDEHRLKISAAIVTANRPLQLERCLNSLRQQVRSLDELIVVDSGMEAPVRRLVEKIQAPWPVHYLSIDPAGVARARNTAVKAARGEIVAFVDDDATVAPDWLERLERVFLRDPRVGLAAGAVLNMPCPRNDVVWKFMEVVEKI